MQCEAVWCGVVRCGAVECVRAVLGGSDSLGGAPTTVAPHAHSFTITIPLERRANVIRARTKVDFARSQARSKVNQKTI